MDEQLRTQFTSWDGLEEEECSDLKSMLQTLTDLKTKQARGKTVSRAAEKRIQDETSKLISITRSWARRPLPTTKDTTSLSDTDRAKLRKVYMIVLEGLRTPTAVLDPSFITRLRNSCELVDRIGPTGSDPPQAVNVEDIEDVIMKDREDILEEARRIKFSPAPSFEDIKEEPENISIRESKLPFFIDEDIRSQYTWPDEEMRMARATELDKGDIVDVPGEMYGTVRYIGPVKDIKETYVGIELSEEFEAMGISGGDFGG